MMESLRRLHCEIIGLARHPSLEELMELLEAARRYEREWAQDPGEKLACFCPFPIPAAAMAYTMLCCYCSEELMQAVRGWRNEPGLRRSWHRGETRRAGKRLERLCRRRLRLTKGEVRELRQIAARRPQQVPWREADALLASYYEWLLPQYDLVRYRECALP